MRKYALSHVAFLITLLLPHWAWAADVLFKPVAPGVFAHIGETGPRTYDNEGLNNNLGLVVTADGALLIDSGASFQGAKDIHAAAKKVTSQPIKWVINTGGQDHRWLGNGYFLAQGAQIMAHSGGKADMIARGGLQLAALQPVLKEKLQGTHPVLPNRWLTEPQERLELGGTPVEVIYRGGAHTPGDLIVWLPGQKVAFTGDVVYIDRMLGIFPFSHTGRWMDSLQALQSLKPETVVPGHGRVATLDQVQADTVDYLQALRAHMTIEVREMTNISEAVRSFNAQRFMRLLNAVDLHPGNASRTYLELERE
jgi:glyoxylase-like metal-dependent hydrolase (beta-lactamase superfamily II)